MPKNSLILTDLDIQTHFFSVITHQISFINVSVDNFSSSRGFLLLKVIDFLLCVGIVIARKWQGTAVSSDIFSIFQLIVLNNHWLDFSLQGPNLKLSAFGEPLVFGKVGFAPCVGVLTVSDYQNAFDIDESLL